MNTQEQEKGNIGDNALALVPPVPLPDWAFAPTVAAPPAAPLLPPVPTDIPPNTTGAWDDGTEAPGEPCPVCNSLEYWVSVLGVRHCQICHPPKLHKARVLARKAARLRRKGTPCE